MKKNLHFLVVVVGLFFSFVGVLEAATPPEMVQQKLSVFFQELQAGQVEPAIQHIILGGAIGNNPQQIVNLVNQINNSVNLYGPVLGSEHVKSVAVGDSLVKTIFLSKHTTYPLRWTFVFYKGAATDWVLVNIEFDDNIEALF